MRTTGIPGLAAAALVAAAVAGGCSTRAPSPGTPADTVVGTVRGVGSTPFVHTLVEGEEDTVAVTGPLAPEVARAGGARVRVVGPRAESGWPGPTIEAVDYTILSVDGERPSTGVFRADDRGGYLAVMGPAAAEADSTIRLHAVPDGLRRHPGARVWVVLRDGAVLRYGVLRPAPGDTARNRGDLLPGELREPSRDTADGR